MRHIQGRHCLEGIETKFGRRNPLRSAFVAVSVWALVGTAGLVLASEASADSLKSARALAFGPGGVLFVGDTRGAEIHAYKLPASEFTDQSDVAMGNARTFNGKDLISGIDVKLAALFGTQPNQIVIRDMVVHQPSRQIFMSVERGRGPDAQAAIVKVDHGKLLVVKLAGIPTTSVHIGDEPGEQKLEFGQSQRDLAITDIQYYNGEIFVAGLSNEEFSSTLRRIHYPFDNKVSNSSVEIWHSVHGEFETRAPIVRMMIHETAGKAYLFAAYACTPLVRIPVSALTDKAHVRGETIGELGYGSTPVDMLTYSDASDGKDYLLVANNMRSATRIAIGDLSTVAPMPVNVAPNFGPAGIAQYPIAVTGAQHLKQVDPQWAVEVRRYPPESAHLDLHTLPLPYFLDRADQIVEMNWPNGPDPFGYRTEQK